MNDVVVVVMATTAGASECRLKPPCTGVMSDAVVVVMVTAAGASECRLKPPCTGVMSDVVVVVMVTAAGSTECRLKPPCTAQHYTERQTPCINGLVRLLTYPLSDCRLYQLVDV